VTVARSARPTLQAVVVSGPSGAGKTTVVKALLRDPRFERAVTATTRAPRGAERHGREYFFLAEAAFLEGVGRGEFLEHARVYGNLYGTPRAEPERIRAAGRHAVLVVDVQGAKTLQEQGFRAYYAFLEAPPGALEERLLGRGLDDPAAIERRLAAAEAERAEAHRFDAVLVNDDVEATARALAASVGLVWTPAEGR
jgi:guanylate kinase